VLELCACTSSAIQYHLNDLPDAYGIAIDVRTEDWMRKHIRTVDQARFTPVSMDVRHLTYDVLDRLTHSVWGVPLSRVDVIHHSPMCESLSSASRQSHTTHYSDGYTVPVSDVAKYHLACLESVFEVFRRLSDEQYTGVISAENPYSGFHRLAPVRALAARPGWQLIEQADHCSNTCELDKRAYPRKPTTYLLYNVLSSIDLKRCANDCPFRLPAHPEHHEHLVCNRSTKVPGQRVVHSAVDKARIPLGVFRKLFQHRARPTDYTRAFSAVWKKRAFVALLAISCTTCGHTNNVDDSGPTYTCTQCSSEHTTAGVTGQQPTSPTFAPQTSADLWHDRIGHAVRDLTGVRGTRLPASTKPTCPCTTCALMYVSGPGCCNFCGPASARLIFGVKFWFIIQRPHAKNWPARSRQTPQNNKSQSGI
jgi:hypothetical protein